MKTNKNGKWYVSVLDVTTIVLLILVLIIAMFCVRNARRIYYRGMPPFRAAAQPQPSR